DYDAVLQELGTYFGRSASLDRHLQRYSAGDGDQRSPAPPPRHSQRLDDAQDDLAQAESPSDEGQYDPYGNSNRDDGSWSSGWSSARRPGSVRKINQKCNGRAPLAKNSPIRQRALR